MQEALKTSGSSMLLQAAAGLCGCRVIGFMAFFGLKGLAFGAQDLSWGVLGIRGFRFVVLGFWDVRAL